MLWLVAASFYRHSLLSPSLSAAGCIDYTKSVANRKNPRKAPNAIEPACAQKRSLFVWYPALVAAMPITMRDTVMKDIQITSLIIASLSKVPFGGIVWRKRHYLTLVYSSMLGTSENQRETIQRMYHACLWIPL